MDRQIVYPGQIPLETDLLNTNRNTMIALGKLAAAIFGTGGIVNGLAVGPTSPASLSVSVGAGEIYQLANVDDTAYSSLPADTTDTVVKQGIQLQPATLSCPAPSTSGFSINYLIEAKFQSSDTGSVVLPYYNASNPQQAFSGPNDTGAAQAVTRAGTVSLQAKAGIAATTGTQTTPAVDAGYIALAVVTVANGQATITSGNIVAQSANILSSALLSQLSTAVQTSQFTGSNQSLANPGYQKLPGGLILQWGTVTTNGTTTKSVTFPIAFPNALLADAVVPPDGNLVAGTGATATTRTYTTKTTAGAASASGITFNYVAVGW